MDLSLRGLDAAKPSDTFVVYEVLGDSWHEQKNPSGYVNLGVAENTLAHDALAKHMHEHIVLGSEHFTYGTGATGSPQLKQAIARFLGKHLTPSRPLEQSHITVTNGIDPLSIDAVSQYEKALLAARSEGIKVVGLVLCNPHNPLGRCYAVEFLVEIMRLCKNYGIHLISDEIYALSVWENTVDEKPEQVPFRSCLSVSLQGVMDPSKLHVIWGMSKDFGANGVRIGAIISQHNPTLHLALTPVSLYSSPSSISEHVTANILNDDTWVDTFLATNSQNLKNHHEFVVAWAKKHRITYKPGVNAAFFLWVDLGTAFRIHRPRQIIEDIDEAVSRTLLSNKVFFASRKSFGSEQPRWFRIMFSNHQHILAEGLKRIQDAIYDA